MPRKQRSENAFQKASTTYPCDNPECDQRVRATKPSKTGLHFCTNSRECQAEKARRLRITRGEAAKAPLVNGAVALVDALLTVERVKCWNCGLTNALPGYAHPDGKGGGCISLGKTPYGDPDFGMTVVNTIWPYTTSVWEPEPASME